MMFSDRLSGRRIVTPLPARRPSPPRRGSGFVQSAEEACKPYYAPRMGAPSLPPGRYFRMHMIGYFEGIDSERGLCVALRGFVLAARFRTSRGSRSFVAVAHALSSAARGARDGVRLGAEARGRARPCEGRADRRRRLDDGGQRRVAHDRTIARY